MAHAAPRFISLAEDNRPEPRSQFDMALHRLLDDLFEAQPVWATAVGFHDHDDSWPNVTETGRQNRLAMLRHHRARFQALADEELSADERIDCAIVLEEIEAMEFHDAELREGAWDPLSYVQLSGSGLFTLLARDFAPWAHRGAAVAGRLRGLPQLLEDALEALSGLPGRPVSLLHTDTALKQLAGVSELIDEALAEAERKARAETDAAQEGDDTRLLEAIRDAAGSAREGLDRFRHGLAEEVKPRAQGEGRLGPELFQAKLRHTLGTELPYSELLARARKDLTAVRAELVRIARELWPQWMPDEEPPDDEEKVVERVMDAFSREHQQPHQLLDWCREEVTRIEQFCRENDVVGLTDEPLKITWTPVFMRAYGRAFLDSPGVLDKGQSSHFWITPPNEEDGPEAVESYMREENDRMLTILCIHEGVPGHYLQLAWSNRCQRLARAVFGSGLFAEGWAVYVTQVMMDLGYRSDDPATMLAHWKYYLRATINVILDVETHTGGMTEEQAMELMVKVGLQEEDEARAKWLRARLTSTQLSTYYVGSLELWDLELEVRRRAARATGATEDNVPQPRIVGDIGPTPGFDYRDHLESVISHGTPAPKWVSQILLGASGRS